MENPPPPGWWRDLPWRKIAVVLAISFVVQQAASLNVKLLTEYDEGIYWDVSRNCWLTGRPLRSSGLGQYFFDHPPFFLYLASPVFALSDTMHAFRTVVSLWSLAIVALTAALAARAFGKAAALPAAIVLGLNPMFVYYGHSGYQDVPFCLPIALAFLAAFAGRPLVSGACTGAAFLIKYFALGFAGCLGFFHWLTGGKRAAALYSAMVAAAAILWVLFGLAVDTQGFLWKAGYWDDLLSKPAEGRMLHHTVDPMGVYLQHILDRITPCHALLMTAGAIWCLVRLRSFALPAQCAILTGLSYVGVLLGGFSLRSDRYFAEALPLLAVMTGAMTAAWPARVRQAVLAIVCIAGLFIPQPGMSRLPQLVRPQYGPAVLDFVRNLEAAAAAAREELRPGEFFYVNWNGPRLFYYTRQNYIVFFGLKKPAVLEQVAKARVLLRDHESGGWYLPHFTPADLAELDRVMAAEFEARAFGRVTLFVRRAPVKPAGP